MNIVNVLSPKLTRRGLLVLVLIAALMGSITSVSADAAGDADSKRLVLTVAPGSLPAKASEHTILSVQLIGPTGVPVLLSEPKTIRLFSSDPRVASVDSEFVIPAGSSFAIATIYVSGEAGPVNFTASADGVSPGHGALEVAAASEAAVGTTLTLFPMPDRLIAGALVPGRAMVAVVDSLGSPVPSAFDVVVHLASSDETILGVPGSVTIPAGAPGVFIDVIPGEAGSGQLIAVADGYSSTGIGINVAELSDEPTHLSAVVVPERWDHSGIGTPLLVVQALSNEDMAPGYLPCGIIFLASSNPDLLSVPGQVDVPCDTNVTSIEVPLVSRSTTGYALITVATPGLVSTSTSFNAVNRAPDELKSWVLPPKPAAGDEQAPVVIVQLVDHEGTPVAAPRPMPITVRAGDTTFEGVVQIGTGDSYAAFPYSLIANEGDSAEMWISAAGVSSVSLNWSNTEMPVQAEIVFSDDWRYQSEPITATITVKVQGRALVGALITWDVENGNAYLASTETDENGQVSAEIRSSRLGQTQVSALVTSDAIGTIKVKNHFDSVSPGEQFAPEAKLLGLPAGVFAWLVVIAAVAIVLFDFWRTGHLGPWGPEPTAGKQDGRTGAVPRKPRRVSSGGRLDAQPVSKLLRLLVFRGGRDSFPLPKLLLLEKLEADQLECVRSEYVTRMGSVVGDGDSSRVPLGQRELIASAAAVTALERLVERQTRDSEFAAALRTAESALNAASYLNNLRMAAGGGRLDRTRLWVLYSRALLNAERFDEAMTAVQAASKMAGQIGSEAMWAATIDELEGQIRARIIASQESA